MNAVLPDFLRSLISTLSSVIMMSILLHPKYSKKVTLITMLFLCVIYVGSAIPFYIRGEFTFIAKMNVVIFTVLCFVMRPLFKDTFMQWLFSYLTVHNINMAVTVLSYVVSRYLPNPPYAHVMMRLLLFCTVIFVLVRYVRPLYRQAVEYWTTYFLVAVSIAVTFSYYTIVADDIVTMLNHETIPLLLVILMGWAAYTSIFLSLNNLQREYSLKDENQLMKSEQEYLRLYAKSMTERIQLMDEAAQQYRIASHDRRHFSNMLLGLLKQERFSDAMVLLEKQTHVTILSNRIFSNNTVLNAALTYYVSMAEKAGIRTEILLDLPSELPLDEVEFAMVISNLLENAIHGCLEISDDVEKYIRCTCHTAGRLLMEIENPCSLNVRLDEEGLPVAQSEQHGTGTRSVQMILRKYNGELLYRIEDGVFRVRVLI